MSIDRPDFSKQFNVLLNCAAAILLRAFLITVGMTVVVSIAFPPITSKAIAVSFMTGVFISIMFFPGVLWQVNR